MVDNRECNLQFALVLGVQLASIVVASLIAAIFSDQPSLIVSSGYGALIMLIVNALLARKIRGWERLQSTEGAGGRAAAVAGGRFVLIVALLITGQLAGLWLPAVAGGMLIAQISVYITGFWLLINR
ncbi:MAG: hypothetical protein Q9M13_09700 [Mariprofundales bacterium]|nr:hypothetical protein [Mariprofundales bacterium]